MSTYTPRILVVDDSKNLRQIVMRYLQAGGVNAQFTEAGNGEEANQALQLGSVLNEPIDVVILDWMMPKLSGLEFLKQMRATDTFKNFPAVVMLTAETYSEQISACLQFKVSTYVTKPFTQADIVEAVQKAIRERQAYLAENPPDDGAGENSGGLANAV